MTSDVEFITETVYYGSAPPTNPTVFAPPEPITMRLRAQQLAIRGVSVDAEHCPGSVTVYQGTSPNGFGYVIQPGTARAFGISQSSAIFVVFGQASAPGYARISAYSAPIVAYGIGTGAPALTAELAGVRKRLGRIRKLLVKILAKIP